MKLTQLSSQDFKQIADLLTQKDALLGQVAKIDRQLAAFEGGAPVAAPKAPVQRVAAAQPAKPAKVAKVAKVAKAAIVAKPAKPAAAKPAPAPKGAGKRTARGALKASIMAELRKAGAAGVKAGDLAKKFGVPPRNIYAWFFTTGQNVPGLKKVGKAEYRLETK